MRQVVPPFQGLGCLARHSQGVALGWDEAGALPLRSPPATALDTESLPGARSKGAEVLENLKRTLSKGRR